MSQFFNKIEGLDFSPGMIIVADSKKREEDLNHHRFRNVSFEVRDVEETPIDYGTGSIDLVTACFGMGSFVERLVPFLTLVKEQLRPGGKAVFSFYNKEALLYSVPPPWRDYIQILKSNSIILRGIYKSTLIVINIQADFLNSVYFK